MKGSIHFYRGGERSRSSEKLPQTMQKRRKWLKQRLEGAA